MLPDASVAESDGASVSRFVSALDAAAARASELCPIESVSLLSRGLGALDEDAISCPSLLGTVISDFHNFNVFVKKL